MRNIKSTILFSVILLLSCNTHKKFTKAENALDAVREFTGGCLNGDFEKAAFFMLHDSINDQYLEKERKIFEQKNGADKKQLKESSIIINEDATINDSIHIINYKNSFDKVPHSIKIILKENIWLVDLKYSFNGNL